MRFRKRPVEVDAMQFHGGPVAACELIDWVLTNGGTARYHQPVIDAISPYRPDDINTIEHPERIAIDTIDPSTAYAFPGDWIIRGAQGEFYPCKPNVFDANYTPINDEETS